jgi:rhamnogalacturonyl hydrolase YesR
MKTKSLVMSGLSWVVAMMCPALRADESANTRQAAAERDALLASMPATFAVAEKQYAAMMATIKDPGKLPRTAEHGKLTLVKPSDWTSGFFPGSLWYLHEYMNDGKWREAAAAWTARVESAKDHRGDHDVGFMIGCSYGNGWRLTGDTAYRDVMVHAARTLSLRFKPEVGLIRSWDFGKWKYPVIVDNMMNLELLCDAAQLAGEPRLREIAVLHADGTLRNHFRPDSSSYHVVDYDPANGAVLHRQTHQGAADGSSWARGQAWGLYGFTMMHRETGKPEYLSQATKIANFIMNHPRLPADKVPYWDFDAPGIPDAPRDASAAAIMASALIELGAMTGGKDGAEYLELARRQLVSLSSPAYLAKPGENHHFILMHSVGNKPGNSEVDVPLNYADYYFLEALLRYRSFVTKGKALPGSPAGN